MPTLRHVPWTNWNEWLDTYKLLYSHQPQERCEGLDRVAIWRTKSAKLPSAVDSTAHLLEVSTYQPFNGVSLESLKLMKAMAVVRTINTIVDEKQTGAYAQSIAAIATGLGIPKWLVDVRHEATHNRLPSLEMLSLSVDSLIEWLRGNYWLKQVDAIVKSCPSKAWCLRLFGKIADAADPSHATAPMPPTRQEQEKLAEAVSSYTAHRKQQLVSLDAKRECAELPSTLEAVLDICTSTSTCENLFEASIDETAVSDIVVPLLVHGHRSADEHIPLLVHPATSPNPATADFGSIRATIDKWEPVVLLLQEQFPFSSQTLFDSLCENFFALIDCPDADRDTCALSYTSTWIQYLLSRRWIMLADKAHQLPRSLFEDMRRLDLVTPSSWTNEEAEFMHHPFQHVATDTLCNYDTTKWIKQCVERPDSSWTRDMAKLFSSTTSSKKNVKRAHLEQLVQASAKLFAGGLVSNDDLSPELVAQAASLPEPTDAQIHSMTQRPAKVQTKWTMVEEWTPCAIGLRPTTLMSHGPRAEQKLQKPVVASSQAPFQLAVAQEPMHVETARTESISNRVQLLV